MINNVYTKCQVRRYLEMMCSGFEMLRAADITSCVCQVMMLAMFFLFELSSAGREKIKSCSVTFGLKPTQFGSPPSHPGSAHEKFS